MSGPGPVGVTEGRASAVGLTGGLLARTQPILPGPRGIGGAEVAAVLAAGRGQPSPIAPYLRILKDLASSPDAVGRLQTAVEFLERTLAGRTAGMPGDEHRSVMLGYLQTIDFSGPVEVRKLRLAVPPGTRLLAGSDPQASDSTARFGPPGHVFLVAESSPAGLRLGSPLPGEQLYRVANGGVDVLVSQSGRQIIVPDPVALYVEPA